MLQLHHLYWHILPKQRANQRIGYILPEKNMIFLELSNLASGAAWAATMRGRRRRATLIIFKGWCSTCDWSLSWDAVRLAPCTRLYILLSPPYHQSMWVRGNTHVPYYWPDQEDFCLDLNVWETISGRHLKTLDICELDKTIPCNVTLS